MTQKFLRAAVLQYLETDALPEGVRRRIDRGFYGPVFVRKGRQRGRLVLLQEALARLDITETAIDAVMETYTAARKRDWPAIAVLAETDVTLVTPAGSQSRRRKK